MSEAYEESLAAFAPESLSIAEPARTIGNGVRITRRMLRNGPASDGNRTGRTRKQLNDAIARAKLEWESTADSLADVVCLLDPGMTIVRANRTVERWSLATVMDAAGRSPHALLHGDCSDDACSLRKQMRAAWQRLAEVTETEFAHNVAVRGDERRLRFRLRLLARDAATREVRDPGAVLVISDTTELHQARDALQSLNAELEDRVRERTAKLRSTNRVLRNEVLRRENAERKLRESHSELVLLSERLIDAQESERRRIALELHDSVGQTLSALKYSLERAVQLLAAGQADDAGKALDLAVRGVRAVAESSRNIAMNLRPTVLDDLGAASAVSWFCREFGEIYTRLDVHCDVAVDDRQIPDRLDTEIFRCVQELLNNVAKHARARRVNVALRMDDLTLNLDVRDDGIGFDRAAVTSQGHGLRNVRERAELSGGAFTIDSPPRGGTVARIEWRLLPDEVEGHDHA
ncbi:MAG: histidine kinase [Steroidobacteraceae bacterium]